MHLQPPLAQAFPSRTPSRPDDFGYDVIVRRHIISPS